VYLQQLVEDVVVALPVALLDQPHFLKQVPVSIREKKRGEALQKGMPKLGTHPPPPNQRTCE
jgi:hypothetical protein